MQPTHLVLRNTFYEVHVDASLRSPLWRTSSEPPLTRRSRRIASQGADPSGLRGEATEGRASPKPLTCTSSGGTDAESTAETAVPGLMRQVASCASADSGDDSPLSSKNSWQHGHKHSDQAVPAPQLLSSRRHRRRPAAKAPAPCDERASRGERGRPTPSPVAPDQRTTVVMRNLPSYLTRGALKAALDEEGFARRYDYLYLPIHFETASAFGHAFVNLVHPGDTSAFFETFTGYGPWAGSGQRGSSVSWSTTHQGLRALVEHYRNSTVMRAGVPDHFRPVVLDEGVRVHLCAPTEAETDVAVAAAAAHRGGATPGA